MLGLEPPADAGAGDPPLEPAEVIVVEREPPADGLAVCQVQHRRGGHPSGDEVEQRAHRAENRIGLPDGSVGKADAEAGRMRTVVVFGVLLDAPGAEGGRDQRREVLDVGAHDQHVAGLERLVVGEEPQDAVAQHLDLTGAAVAGVDLHAAVVRADRLRDLRRRVVSDLMLQPAEEGSGGQVHRVVLGGGGGPEQELQLPDVPSP